jgi:hypothetical protein
MNLEARFFAFFTLIGLTGIPNPQSLNSYSYAEGNPITKSDPDGLLTKQSPVNITRNLLADLFAFANNLAAFVNTLTNNPSGSAQAAKQGLSSFASNPSGYARTWGSSAAQKASKNWKDLNSGDDAAQERAITNWIELSGTVISGTGARAATGVAADSAETMIKLPHANSLDFAGENYGYKLVQKESGAVLKFGETTNPRTRYSDQWLSANNLQLNVVVYGSKAAVHDWQHEMIISTRGAGAPLPLNKSNW